ncbi:40S ribosomal protein S5-1 [Hordeum vulgare]|nr:40S ribosomal protein S5-1 [Hordeum vulgare]
MPSPKALKDKFFEKVINPYLVGVLQHPQSIKMREGVLHICDVEGPKKTGSMEARIEAMEQQVFKCQGMVERRLNANHMMITKLTNKHKIDANDIGKHLSRLYDRIDHLEAQIYDLQNQNSNTSIVGYASCAGYNSSTGYIGLADYNCWADYNYFADYDFFAGYNNKSGYAKPSILSSRHPVGGRHGGRRRAGCHDGIRDRKSRGRDCFIKRGGYRSP